MTTPNPAVFDPHTTYICTTGGCLASVDHFAKPEREIAGNFLEEVGDWLTALTDASAPPRVMLAVRAAHDAACRWTADLDKPHPEHTANEPRRGA